MVQNYSETKPIIAATRAQKEGSTEIGCCKLKHQMNKFRFAQMQVLTVIEGP